MSKLSRFFKSTEEREIENKIHDIIEICYEIYSNVIIAALEQSMNSSEAFKEELEINIESLEIMTIGAQKTIERILYPGVSSHKQFAIEKRMVEELNNTVASNKFYKGLLTYFHSNANETDMDMIKVLPVVDMIIEDLKTYKPLTFEGLLWMKLDDMIKKINEASILYRRNFLRNL